MSDQSSIKLHLGCGEINLPGFVNIDIVPTSAVDRVLDIRKLDYPDLSVDLIYSAHVLEHFPQTEVVAVLQEWQRVLKSGAALVLVVPNFDRMVDRYMFANPLGLVKYMWLTYVCGRPGIRSGRPLTANFIADFTGGALFPDISPDPRINYHKTLFNLANLKKLTHAAGFSDVKVLKLGQGKFPIPMVDPKKLHWSSIGLIIYK